MLPQSFPWFKVSLITNRSIFAVSKPDGEQYRIMNLFGLFYQFKGRK